MTTDAIQRAWDERKSASDYQNLADAAYSRSYADWLIGMNGSRIAEVFLPKETDRTYLPRTSTNSNTCNSRGSRNRNLETRRYTVLDPQCSI